MKMTRNISKWTLMTAAISAMLLVSACGRTDEERTATGGAIGAGIGAVGAMVLAADPITGAVLGGMTGAVTGAATDEDDINLDNID